MHKWCICMLIIMNKTGVSFVCMCVYVLWQTRGASKLALSIAQHRFYLPMAGMAQSLNISVACAVTMAQLMLLAPPLAPLSPEEKDEWLAKWLMRDVNSSKAVLHKAGIECPDL